MAYVLKMVYGAPDGESRLCADFVAIISSRVKAAGSVFGRISRRYILEHPFLRDCCAAYVHVGTAVCCYTRKTLNRIYQI